MHRPQADAAEPDLVTVAPDDYVGVRRRPLRSAHAGTDDHRLPAEPRLQFARAAHTIGVDVSLEDVRDAQPLVLRDADVVVRISVGSMTATSRDCSSPMT